MYNPTQVCVQAQNIKLQQVLHHASTTGKLVKILLMSALQAKHPEQMEWYGVVAKPDASVESQQVDNLPSTGWRELGAASDGKVMFIWHPVYGGYSLAVKSYLAYVTTYGPLAQISLQFAQDLQEVKLLPSDYVKTLPCKNPGDLLKSEGYLSSLTPQDIGREIHHGKHRYVYCGTEYSTHNRFSQTAPRMKLARLLSMATLEMYTVSLEKEPVTYIITDIRHPELVMLNSRGSHELEPFLASLPEVLRAVLTDKKKLIMERTILARRNDSLVTLSIDGTAHFVRNCGIGFSVENLLYMQQRHLLVFKKQNQYVLAVYQGAGVTPKELLKADTTEELVRGLNKILNFEALIQLAAHPKVELHIGFRVAK